MAADVDEEHGARPVAVQLLLEVAQRHAEVVAVAVDELDARAGVDRREGGGHEGVRGAEHGRAAHLEELERRQRCARPAREGERGNAVPVSPVGLEVAAERPLGPLAGVDDEIPEFVETVPIALVEADREA